MGPFLVGMLVLSITNSNAADAQQAARDHALVKARYVRFLVGTDDVFTGSVGPEARKRFLRVIGDPIRRAKAFDYTRDSEEPFRAFPEDPGYLDEVAVYSPLLQQYLLPLAYGYCVDVSDNPHYQDAEVLACYVRCLDYLHDRGIRDGMTFHRNRNRMEMRGAPRPGPGCANLVDMELRMGALCRSVLLMEPHIRDTPTYQRARALISHLEMLGRTSGHVRYYEPYVNPAAFAHRVQSDAIQNFTDTTLVSALLATDPHRQHVMLLEAQRVLTDSLRVIPGWADTIKPDYVGYHHRGIYGNAYTGGFISQAAFGVYLLRDTAYAVAPASIENLKQLILTYRLYCQKYAMPMGIRGRMPLSTDQIKTSVFTGVMIFASSLGLDDETMRPVFARLWDPDRVGVDFAFVGGRGKRLRGLYPLQMLHELEQANPRAEPDPCGFWYKPYGGLALYRRDDWLAAIKGHSKYIWDYENGDPDENVYGQCLSHGMLTIFAQGDPIDDRSSGYQLDAGWDWYRLPGTTAVHFPLVPQTAMEHRRFSQETFLGAASCDGQSGVWGMILNQPKFGDGTPLDLRACKSAFFVNDSIVLLGSGISGGDGTHHVETTLFQTFVEEPESFRVERSSYLIDSAGNGYYVPDIRDLKVRVGEQSSFRENGRTPTQGNYAVAWIDHGLRPDGASYHWAVKIRGGRAIRQLADRPDSSYRVVCQTDTLHHVEFPGRQWSGLVFFTPGIADHAIVAEARQPSLVACRVLSDGHVRLGVVHPDLGLLDPEAPTPTFKFIAKNENQYMPSRPRTVELVLRGAWRPVGEDEHVTVVSESGKQTTLRFTTLDGMAVQVELAEE